jgi:hypothetical protein
MKHLGILLVLIIAIIACSGNKKKNPQPTHTGTESSLVSYKYKVAEVQDSIIADSIWKMIFRIEGIDKLVISRADCTVVFTIDPELVSSDSLKREMSRRGGQVRK